MQTISVKEYASLEEKIYDALIDMTFDDETGGYQMGCTGEARDSAKFIIEEWAKENGIQVEEN
jgi:hypothetical protein